MLGTDNHSIHYKMYKSGKSWVFAGLISAGLLLGFGGETAFAATPADSDSSAPQTEQVSPEKPVAQPSSQNDPTTLSKSGSDPAPVQSPEDNNPTEPKDSQSDNDPAPSDEPDKNIAPQDNEETNPSNLHKNNDSTSGITTDSLNKTPGDSDVSSIKQAAPERPQPRLAMAPAAPTPAPAASPVAVTAPIAEDDESIDVWMPNKTLQTLVAKQLKTSISKLTKDSLTGLTSLSVEHYNSGGKSTFIDGDSSFSLEGLQYATNLKSLDLGWNMYDNMFDGHTHGDITDVTPLKNLINLTTLDLQNNRITDVSALGGLKNLKSLNILGNGIADFSMLDSNQITNFQFGTQSVVWPTTYTIDPKSPQITIPQILKLPQNYQGSKNIVLDVPSDYSDTQVEDPIFYDHQTGLNTRRVYKRGSDIALNEDGVKAPSTANGSVTFIDIHDQEMPGNAGSSWSGSTVIQNPMTYYLLEDFVSGDNEIQIDIFIPYVNPQPAANLTVHYVDMADNKPIQDDKIIKDKLTSDTYDLTTEETNVKGYTFDHADGSLTGNFSADPLTVTLYFTKDPTKPVTPVTPPVVTPTTQTTVTAHYIDQNGKIVHADQVLTGHAGDSYSTTAFTIPGYDLTTTPENASGTFGDTDTTVTYVYRDHTSGNGVEVNIDPTYPNQPAKPVKQEPTTGDQAATIHHPGNTSQKGGAAVRVPATTLTNQHPATSAKSVAASSASKTTLPQTSEHRVTPLLGIAILLGTFLGFGLKRKQH